MKNLNTSIEQFFNDNAVSIGYKEDWGIKNLKFSINKYSKGSFKFMRFNASSEFPKKLDGFLKLILIVLDF
jgi:ribosomal protein S6